MTCWPLKNLFCQRRGQEAASSYNSIICTDGHMIKEQAERASTHVQRCACEDFQRLGSRRVLAGTQTDGFLPRPPTPPFVPPKRGVDAETQVVDNELFDFDFEVRSSYHMCIWLGPCMYRPGACRVASQTEGMIISWVPETLGPCCSWWPRRRQ